MSRRALLLAAMFLARPDTAAAQLAAASAPDTLRLSLEQTIDRVTTQSTAVRMAAARRDEAEAAVSFARASRLPAVTGNAQFAWQPSADETPSGFTWSPDPTAPLDQRVRYLELATPAAGLAALPPQLLALAARYSWTAGISGQFTLLDFGRTRAAVSGASARRNAAHAAVDAERSRARLDAELAYRQLLLARERVFVSVRGRETMAADLDATRSRLARGVASELDTLRSAMQLADVERRLADALAAERGADVQLRVLADLPVGPTLVLTTAIETVSPDALEHLDPSALLDAVEEADRRSAESLVASAEADLRAARAKGRPSLMLRADLQAIQAPSDAFDLGGQWTDVRTLTAAIQVPLLRPISRAEVRGAEARLAQASVDARRVADGATSERVSVRAERERARSTWLAARARLAAAQRAATLTDSAAARGIATGIDQSRAQLDVLEAGTQLLEALIDYLSADAVAGASSRGSAGRD